MPIRRINKLLQKKKTKKILRKCPLIGRDFNPPNNCHVILYEKKKKKSLFKTTNLWSR